MDYFTALNGTSDRSYYPAWGTEKVYQCPRSIFVYIRNPNACGRAYDKARGDEGDTYIDREILRTLIVENQAWHQDRSWCYTGFGIRPIRLAWFLAIQQASQIDHNQLSFTYLPLLTGYKPGFAVQYSVQNPLRAYTCKKLEPLTPVAEAKSLSSAPYSPYALCLSIVLCLSIDPRASPSVGYLRL